MKLKVFLIGPRNGQTEQEFRQTLARKGGELIHWSDCEYDEPWDVINPFHIYDRVLRDMNGRSKEEINDAFAEASAKEMETYDGVYVMDGWLDKTKSAKQDLLDTCKDIGLAVCFNGDHEQMMQFHNNMLMRHMK